MLKTKYKLILNKLDMDTYRPAWIQSVIRDWVKGSEVKKVKSGVIRADIDHEYSRMVYTAFYDSYWWTGRGEPVVKDPQISP